MGGLPRYSTQYDDDLTGARKQTQILYYNQPMSPNTLKSRPSSIQQNYNCHFITMNLVEYRHYTNNFPVTKFILEMAM